MVHLVSFSLCPLVLPEVPATVVIVNQLNATMIIGIVYHFQRGVKSCQGFGCTSAIVDLTKHQFGQRGPTKAHEADLCGGSAASSLCLIEHFGHVCNGHLSPPLGQSLAYPCPERGESSKLPLQQSVDHNVQPIVLSVYIRIEREYWSFPLCHGAVRSCPAFAQRPRAADI